MFLRRYILFFLTFLSLSLQAQQYPVDIQVFVTPPYPQSLRGYADTFEQKIQAHFLLKDLSTAGRPFALRFSLENFQGQSIAQTPDYITPYLVNLSPGVRRTLTNIDFKSLLRYENLYGINEATYNGLLPEGTYFICLSLYDVATGRPVSNKGRAMIQVRRYSPPVLTMPQKGEVLTKKNAFQHIVFQWMPRDVAPFMQYEFTLKEVWDLALVPEEAFMTGRLVYQTKTFSPALAYTNMMPILLENKRYVWQVRAFTNNPNNPNEQSYFKNNGNSETFYFDLVSHCEAPKFLTAITESTSAQLRWSAQAMMSNQEYPYKVMYREKGKTWKSQKVSMPYAKLTGLKRGRTYIYKVGVACGLNTANSTSVFGEDSYVYSTEQEFTTTEQIDEKSQVQCGVKPEIRIKNTEPLQDNLYANTTFTAGDFPVTVLNATGSNGVYSGEGYVKVPYLQDTKIKVVFNGIKLNTERQLIEGKLVTTYDETERNVQFIQEGIGEVFGDKGKKDQKMSFEIENENDIQVDSITGRITITGKVDPKTGIAPKVTLPKGRDYVITDSKGKVYQLDESGKVTAKGTREQGTQLAQQAGKGDSKNPPISNKHFKVEWLFNDELANDTTGEIPYKALVKGKTSSFELRIQPADTTQYDFFFHTENGVKVEAESKGEGLYKITRKGAFDFAQEELWVVAKEKKDKKGKKEELIGKCILVHLSPKEVNVALVPTRSGQNLQEAIAQVQQIYEKVGVTLHITTETPFDISDQLKNGTLPTENEFGDLSTYSPEQNAVIAKFTTNRKPKDNTYYIFLVNDGTGDHGYMRLGGQYGFVYSTNARTIAHELGHGIFKLEHPFKGKNADKGKTTALMDYNQGQDFFYRDWKQINDPKVKLYAFQGQSEGKNVGEGQAHYVCIDDNLRKILYDKGYHFYNINGEPIELSSQDFTVAFMGEEEGTYYGRLGMVNHRGVYHSYAILNKNPQGYYINSYSKSKFVPKKGSKEKAVWVRINNKGEYLIENSDKTISVKGKTEIVDCLSFITIKSAEQKLSNSLLEEGISEETIKLFLGKGLSADSAEYKEIESFAKYLSTILKGKKWGFLYKSKNDYKEHYGESLFLNVLKDKKIFSEKAFKESFVIRLSEKDKPYYIKDVDLLISNFDSWEGIPEYYNAYSFDYTTFNIPNLDSEQVIDELLNTLEIVLNSSLDACPKCLTQEQKETLEAFIAKRRTKEGKKFILTNKLKERNNFIAAFQLLGAYDRYYYSIKDLEKRSFLADNNWLGEISRREKAGQASAIDIQGGHNQYVAYYGTTSAFFLGFQYFKMYGDLLDLAITNKAINESQRILSKNFKKVWGKGIGNVGKTFTEASSIGKYTKEAIAKEKGFTDILPNLLKKEGLTMDDFHYMMQKHANALTPNEIKKLTRIRKAIPKPDENTLMQKVVTKETMNRYLEGKYAGEVGGSVAIASDTKHLKTFEDYYYGLRLDYKLSNGKYEFYLEEGSCGVIRFKSTEIPDKIIIPKGGTFDEWNYPFTSTGFTSGNNGRLGVPEWNLPERIKFTDGDEIWEVFNDGTQRLRGVYKNNSFIIIE